jgi:hypothetical protein
MRARSTRLINGFVPDHAKSPLAQLAPPRRLPHVKECTAVPESIDRGICLAVPHRPRAVPRHPTLRQIKCTSSSGCLRPVLLAPSLTIRMLPLPPSLAARFASRPHAKSHLSFSKESGASGQHSQPSAQSPLHPPQGLPRAPLSCPPSGHAPRSRREESNVLCERPVIAAPASGCLFPEAHRMVHHPCDPRRGAP